MDLESFRNQLDDEANRLHDAMTLLGYMAGEARSIASSAEAIEVDCAERLGPIKAILEGLDQLDENRNVTDTQMQAFEAIRNSTSSLDGQIDRMKGVMFDG